MTIASYYILSVLYLSEGNARSGHALYSYTLLFITYWTFSCDKIQTDRET